MKPKLHLVIGEGSVQELDFDSDKDLLDYIDILKEISAVWLVVGRCCSEELEDSEIIVTESVDFITLLITDGYLMTYNLHIQQYDTYEDAYNVALDMKEGNSKQN